MNARGDANRSVRMTKARLCGAFTQLAQQKPTGEITVRELTTLAKVSRGTFYFHYSDIGGFIAGLEQEQLDQLNRLMDALLPAMDETAPPAALQALFEYLNENSGVCSALLGANGDPTFADRLETLIGERCLGYLGATVKTPLRRYLTAFSVHGCLGCVAAWFVAGRRESPAEMAGIVWQAIRAMYRSATPGQA